MKKETYKNGKIRKLISIQDKMLSDPNFNDNNGLLYGFLELWNLISKAYLACPQLKIEWEIRRKLQLKSKAKFLPTQE